MIFYGIFNDIITVSQRSISLHNNDVLDVHARSFMVEKWLACSMANDRAANISRNLFTNPVTLIIDDV